MKRLMMVLSVACCMPLAASLDAGAAAPPPDGGGDDARPPRPPKEAIEACADANAGDACSFEGRDGDTTAGTCEPPPRDDDKPLACRPERPPPR